MREKGKIFRLRDSNGFPYQDLFVNVNGEVTWIEHDTSFYAGDGKCSYTQSNQDFKIHVRCFMEDLLRRDISEFESMKGALKQEWRKMAEEVLSAASTE